MIFVVKLTEHHDALGAIVAGEDMEIEQYHLAGEIREAANLSLVVLQGNFNASVYAHLACLNLLLCTLPVNDTDILHALDGDVVQVLATLCSWIVSIPACSYGSEYFHVILVVARVEDE